MNCFNCGKPNRPGSAFCQYCGQKLDSKAAGETSVISKEAYPPAATYAPPTKPAHPTTFQAKPSEKQMGDAGTQLLDIWGPFAGYGNRGHHASWLLNDLADKANPLHEAVTKRFEQREIPHTKMQWRTLTGKGVQVEQRPFFLIERGITTVALYIGRFGRDLFISQVTYAKGPISSFRVLVLGLMVLFQLYYTYGYGSTLANTIGGYNPFFGSGPDIESILFMLCIIGPLGLLNTVLLALALTFSIYKFLKDKDFLALLRVPPNEFQMDDIVALEKSIEESVRQSLDQVDIDSALMPPKIEQRTDYQRRLI